MSDRSQAALATFFDRQAAVPELCRFTPEERARLQVLLDRWDIRPGTRVLEPGCGGGRLTELLAQAVGPTGRVIACDLSPGMLRAARARRLPAWVRLLRAEAARLPLPAGSVDLVVCFCVFPHFTRPEQVLAELARALSPGGTLWICHLLGRCEVNALHRRAGPPVANHYRPSPWRLRKLLAAAGLAVRSLQDDDDGFCVLALNDRH